MPIKDVGKYGSSSWCPCGRKESARRSASLTCDSPRKAGSGGVCLSSLSRPSFGDPVPVKTSKTASACSGAVAGCCEADRDWLSLPSGDVGSSIIRLVKAVIIVLASPCG